MVTAVAYAVQCVVAGRVAGGGGGSGRWLERVMMVVEVVDVIWGKQ